MKRAVIVGSNGQDGRLLFDNLLARGYSLIGIDQSAVRCHGAEWNTPVDLGNCEQVAELIKRSEPDEIYYLAAYHHSAEDTPPDPVELYAKSHEIHVQGLVHVLESLRKTRPAAHLFYAASSHIFKGSGTMIQNESTPVEPRCMYGITKAAGMYACRLYRAVHGIHASVGILYNHESTLRNEKFVTMKIIKAAVRIKQGLQENLVLGDLGAGNDWGYAPDYVEAFRLIVNADQASDYIVATGVRHTVRDFVEIAFGSLGLDWRTYVKEDRSIIAKQQAILTGDSSRLRTSTGWRPSVDFAGMIKLLLAGEGVSVDG